MMPQPTVGGMEQVHGVDVSWMTQGNPKEKANRQASSVKQPGPAPAPASAQSPAAQSRRIPTPPSSTSTTNGASQTNGNHSEPSPSPSGSSVLKGRSRSGSTESQRGPNGTPPQRRGSWFSSISAKFSGSSASVSTSPQGAQTQNGHHHHHLPHHAHQGQLQQPQAGQEPLPQPSPQAELDEPPVPKITPIRSAVLPHAVKVEGSAPYTPAPPRSGQAGFLGVLRRLSSSGGGSGINGKLGNGLVQRRTLNIDQDRERCPISELKDSKLRRVAFCVDVEIAPMPKYVPPGEATTKCASPTQKKKLVEKSEGETLKNAAKASEDTTNGSSKSCTDVASANARDNKFSQLAGDEGDDDIVDNAPAVVSLDGPYDHDDDRGQGKSGDKETTRKKEKKKKSEEERKARKEKKRKLAEANGTVPLEIHYSSDDTEEPATGTPVKGTSGTVTPRGSGMATTNPVRIYRRCCQLRETPILKKITEQLSDVDNASASSGLTTKLDLTDYPMQLPDLITLGDFLAVVPVREVILENSSLGDEGLRVILAGLLAAKQPESKRQKPKHQHEGRGGLVERLVLKNNKLGPDGWKHIALFIYLCRTLKYLDVSRVEFPRQSCVAKNASHANGLNIPRSIAEIFAKALSERLGGAGLELLNLGETDLSADQLGTIMDGVIACAIPRLGLAHNHIDMEGLEHVARYLAAGICEGLDLGGNDLREHVAKIASSIKEDHPLWALSLAGCNLEPSSLCHMLPSLVKLNNFRFIDFSHNQALFETTPSAVGLLRRYLPQMKILKRIHLQDVGISAEQAIALVEVLPEISHIAHISLLENAKLVALAEAQTEEAQEEACALYASLMAAARVSRTVICIDIEVPGEKSGDIIKAMAKQVVAYCLRNMDQIPEAETTLGGVGGGQSGDAQLEKPAAYSDVVAHLVGRDVLGQDDDDDDATAPDGDYVIGGTGVVKALTFCLKSRGEESNAGEMLSRANAGEDEVEASLPTGGKAKDMSKHLLAGARKIRLRVQPALSKARANPGDGDALRKLTYLDDTLRGIIKRFEDEYPDARESGTTVPVSPIDTPPRRGRSRSPVSFEDAPVLTSDIEDDAELTLARSNSCTRSRSRLSRVIAEEEGQMLRVGHKLRSGFITQQQYNVINTIDEIVADPRQVRMLGELAEDIGGEFLEKVKEKGTIRAYKEDKEMFFQAVKDSDPDHWDAFVESQQKARANRSASSVDDKKGESAHADENAVAD